MTLSLIVLSRILFYKLILILSYFMPKFELSGNIFVSKVSQNQGKQKNCPTSYLNDFAGRIIPKNVPKTGFFPHRSKLKIIKVWSAAVFLEYCYHFLQHTPTWTCNQKFLTWMVISYLSWSSSYGFHQYTVSNIQREFLALNPLKMWRLWNEILRRIQVRKVIICKYK